MPASQCFSRRQPRTRCAWPVLLAILLLTAAGCATLRPEEKEYLAEPAMTWGADTLAQQHELHVLENREGSIGGTGTTGGGCGCN